MNRRRPLLTAVLAAALALPLAGAVGVAPPAQAAAPSNDRISGATAATGIGFSDTVDVSRATSGAKDPTSCVNNASVWYSFTPEADVTVNVNTAGSSYRTAIGVYTGTPGDLTRVRCAFRTWFPQAGLDLAAEAGTTYYFMVGVARRPYDGRDGVDFDGDLTLHFNMLTPLTVETMAVLPDGTVDAASGDARVLLSRQCNYDAKGYGYVTLRQRVTDAFVAKGDNWFRTTCGTTLASRPVAVAPAGDVAFVEGPARATALMRRICSPATGTCTRVYPAPFDVSLAYPAPAP